jgi:hypothetical protein
VQHLRHFYDGYPLCWDYDQDGPFEGTYVESEVDCPDCLGHVAEWTP